MLCIGDKVVYGNMGVCTVKDITERGPRAAEGGGKYYVLEPVYQSCVIYAPADNPKVFIRPVISAERANQLIDMIPNMRTEAFHSGTIQGLAEHYKAALDTHDCEDLIELVMSIYAKKLAAESRSRKIGTVDARFMKQAEELLNGEFAQALGIPKEAVPAYIAARVKKAGEREAVSGATV